MAIVLPLVNAGGYFVDHCLAMQENILLAIVMPIMKAGKYFVGYCVAISECWSKFFWLLSCH